MNRLFAKALIGGWSVLLIISVVSLQSCSTPKQGDTNVTINSQGGGNTSGEQGGGGEDAGGANPPAKTAEVCDGLDNDQNGLVDDNLTAPGLCSNVGVCGQGVIETCQGVVGWVCQYTSPDYKPEETKCDGKDNDCDGKVDEPFKDLGTPCTDGMGICQVMGHMVCNAAGTGTECSAKANPDCQSGVATPSVHTFATGDVIMKSANYTIITDTFEPIGRANSVMQSQDYQIISTHNFDTGQ